MEAFEFFDCSCFKDVSTRSDSEGMLSENPYAIRNELQSSSA